MMSTHASPPLGSLDQHEDQYQALYCAQLTKPWNNAIEGDPQESSTLVSHRGW